VPAGCRVTVWRPLPDNEMLIRPRPTVVISSSSCCQNFSDKLIGVREKQPSLVKVAVEYLLVGVTDLTFTVSPFIVPRRVTLCAAYLASSAAHQLPFRHFPVPSLVKKDRRSTLTRVLPFCAPASLLQRFEPPRRLHPWLLPCAARDCWTLPTKRSLCSKSLFGAST